MSQDIDDNRWEIFEATHQSSGNGQPASPSPTSANEINGVSAPTQNTTTTGTQETKVENEESIPRNAIEATNGTDTVLPAYETKELTQEKKIYKLSRSSYH